MQEDQQSSGNSTRLNKYLALQLGISRREADALIATETVSINGNPAAIGNRVLPSDIISVAGRVISKKNKEKICILFNKPEGYVCSRKRQGKTPTIYDILPKSLSYLKPVGRLDKDSSGLILLTNDGDLAHRLTHPSFHKAKIYKVKLDHQLEPLHQQMISDFGIELEDGRSQLTLERLNESRRDWQVVMSEGRNRQIRRTFAAVGYTVVRLHRIQFGNYSLGSLKRGEWRQVSI